MPVIKKPRVILSLLVLMVSFSCPAGAEIKAGQDQGMPPHSAASGHTSFALALYDSLNDGDGNLFFSPHSLISALTMTYGGARGATGAEMAKVLNLSSSGETAHRFQEQLRVNLESRHAENGIMLHLANALWGQKEYPFLTSFLDLAKIHYDAPLKQVDFTHDCEGARQSINGWVASRTNDRIRDLVPRGVLNAATRLVLTNAIYFKGDWETPFSSSATRNEPFHLSGSRDVTVPLMSLKNRVNYHETAILQAVRLPYAGDNLSMILLLPRTVDGLSRLENELNADTLSAWIGMMKTENVTIFLPRFSISMRFSLSRVLSELGMVEAFTPRADFSGIDGTRNLFLSEVLHKAYVEVDEKGTEAAAATGAVMTLTSLPQEPLTFRADHPFVFIILDDPTGEILFMGRVTDPTS